MVSSNYKIIKYYKNTYADYFKKNHKESIYQKGKNEVIFWYV